MAKKHIPTNGFGDAKEDKLPAYKKKAVPYKEPQFLRDLRLNRERHFWKIYPEDRPQIEEYVAFMKNEWRKQDERL